MEVIRQYKKEIMDQCKQEITINVRILPYTFYSEVPSFLKEGLEMKIYVGGSVEDLLIKLANQIESPFDKIVFNSKTHILEENIIILVNGRLLPVLKSLDTELHHGDLVLIGNVITGG